MSLMRGLLTGTQGLTWVSLLSACAFFLPAQLAQAQTYTVLHSFNGADGAAPAAGLTVAGPGTFYGTTSLGGVGCSGGGCGTVFRLRQSDSGWVLTTLYNFTMGSDGYFPTSGVTIGGHGTLYGTAAGGTGTGCVGSACGLVFNLKPPAVPCRTSLCSWTETVVHQFTGPDGAGPEGALVFDQAGALYGTAEILNSGAGAVFKLTPSGTGWTLSVLYAFHGGLDGEQPASGVIFDSAGNLYGTTELGGGANWYLCGSGCGTVFELIPSGSGWIENILTRFNGVTGAYPAGGLVFDQSGNFYGAALSGATYELTPSMGGWTYSVLYDFPQLNNGGSQASLVMDAAGNLYGTAWVDGRMGRGSVFRLTHSSGNWIFTDLYDFTGGNDGGEPFSTLVFDANGNLYGTARDGGQYGMGVIFEITP